MTTNVLVAMRHKQCTNIQTLLEQGGLIQSSTVRVHMPDGSIAIVDPLGEITHDLTSAQLRNRPLETA